MAEPLLAGADQTIVADASFENVDVIAAAAGTVAGVTDAESAVAGPVPALFTAITRNSYEVPFVKPVTKSDSAVTLLFTVTHDELPESYRSTT